MYQAGWKVFSAMSLKRGFVEKVSRAVVSL